jgi:hypothetical protein
MACSDPEKRANDQIAELWRLPAVVAPGIGGRIADDAEAAGKSRRNGQFSGEGVAFPAGIASAIYMEHVRRTVAESCVEAAPTAVTQRGKLIARNGLPGWFVRGAKPRVQLLLRQGGTGL